MSNELKCWSCKAVFTLSEHADCDGCCWKCGVEIDLNEMDIPAAHQAPVLSGEVEVLAAASFAKNGNIQCWSLSRDHDSLRKLEGEGHTVVELIDRAHATRLQAENNSLRQQLADVSNERDKLQSELAEAQRLLEEASKPTAEELEEDEEDRKKAFVRSNTHQGKHISLEDMMARYAPPQTNTSNQAHCPHDGICHTSDETCEEAKARIADLSKPAGSETV
ncbi:hypothetical protein AABC73_15165 [Pseudomonas sp. G.S.17]|uniref:hypothetical protein n=1 Tax=Pseudomonas sp. G.S.17 TaxID=3137451 RepID=UPI00311C9B16